MYKKSIFKVQNLYKKFTIHSESYRMMYIYTIIFQIQNKVYLKTWFGNLLLMLFK